MTSITSEVAPVAVSLGAAELLERAVGGRLNVLISGGTGTGKTTLLNAIAAFIGRDERIGGTQAGWGA